MITTYYRNTYIIFLDMECKTKKNLCHYVDISHFSK